MEENGRIKKFEHRKRQPNQKKSLYISQRCRDVRLLLFLHRKKNWNNVQ